MSAAILLIGAGCGAKSPAVPVQPAVSPSAAAPSQGPLIQPAADIRVTGIKAITNPAGDITDQGCEGPRVDLVLTLQNLGNDFPTDEGLRQWKEMIDAQAANPDNFGIKPWQETPVLSVDVAVDFGDGRVQPANAGILLSDLPGGKMKNGQTLDVPAKALVPCCDPVSAYSVSAAVRQGSAYFLPTGDKGIKERYEDAFTLMLPDITPGHGQIVRKDGKATVIADVENIGNAPTVGPVKLIVTIPRKDSAFASGQWEMRTEASFTGKVTIGPTEVIELSGEPDHDKVQLEVFMLCPTELYDIVRDANPQNDRIERAIAR